VGSGFECADGSTERISVLWAAQWQLPKMCFLEGDRYESITQKDPFVV